MRDWKALEVWLGDAAGNDRFLPPSLSLPFQPLCDLIISRLELRGWPCGGRSRDPAKPISVINNLPSTMWCGLSCPIIVTSNKNVWKQGLAAFGTAWWWKRIIIYGIFALFGSHDSVSHTYVCFVWFIQNWQKDRKKHLQWALWLCGWMLLSIYSVSFAGKVLVRRNGSHMTSKFASLALCCKVKG